MAHSCSCRRARTSALHSCSTAVRASDTCCSRLAMAAASWPRALRSSASFVSTSSCVRVRVLASSYGAASKQEVWVAACWLLLAVPSLA
jgi:hypothetical protein